MELTIDQKDALTELINIGYGRAAGALSELTGYRITLEVPQVSMHEVAHIAPLLDGVLRSEVASVDQRFTGPVAGTALLLLDKDAAVALSQLLTDDRVNTAATFDSNAREIITEVGNILLNACLGVFGNLLQIQINFAVPHLHVDEVAAVLAAVTKQSQEKLDYGLMVHTRFYVKTNNVTGYLFIVLGIASLSRLLAELKNWEQRQVS